MAFQQLAAGFGNLQALDDIGLVWFAVPILSSSGVFSSILIALDCLLSCKVEFVVQLFYASRIRIIAESDLIAAIIVSVNILFFTAS